MALTPSEQLERIVAAQDPDARWLQDLINVGEWRLEGYVGRQMMAAIEAGICVLGPRPARDYWGNRIPSRYEIVPGSVGSIEYAYRRLHPN